MRVFSAFEIFAVYSNLNLRRFRQRQVPNRKQRNNNRNFVTANVACNMLKVWRINLSCIVFHGTIRNYLFTGRKVEISKFAPICFLSWIPSFVSVLIFSIGQKMSQYKSTFQDLTTLFFQSSLATSRKRGGSGELFTSYDQC